MREFCRCGITNSGAGCLVHCGCIEFADICRTRGGRLCGMEVTAWTEDERNGAEALFRGGIAGGGPLTVLVVEDWILGGSCGNLSFTCSVGGIVFDVMLEVLCRIAEVAFDIDCAIEFCGAFNGGWVLEIIVVGFSSATMWDVVAWFWHGFIGTLLAAWNGCWSFVSVMKKKINVCVCIPG